MKTQSRALMLALVLLTSGPAWALPVTGFLDASAADGWRGTFTIQLSDGTMASGTSQFSWLYGENGANFASLPLVTSGCVLSTSCVTSDDSTMTFLALNLTGTADLGSFGVVSWQAQTPKLLPGYPSPPVTAKGDIYGLVGGTTLVDAASVFAFDCLFTAFFAAMDGDTQALSAVRIEFADGVDIATASTSVVLDTTPIQATEPSAILLLVSGMVGVYVLVRRRHEE